MPTTRELHRQAMELLDEALYVAKSELRVENLFKRALQFEASAADSVANRLEVEPTRSVLHRGVARTYLINELACWKGVAISISASRSDVHTLPYRSR